MQFPFDERKAAQAAAYLLLKSKEKKINYMKLIKLLYLADRQALLERGKPITGDRMVSMPRGPVLSGILNLINWGQRREEHCVWLEYVSPPSGYDVRLVQDNPELDELSIFECRILDRVYARYGDLDKWSLVDLTHKLPEWHDPRGSSFPIDPADILRAESRSEETIQRIADNARQALSLADIDDLHLVEE
jgi:uncharacterized phage-associated protein